MNENEEEKLDLIREEKISFTLPKKKKTTRKKIVRN
jgi:hypothetical protein